MVMGQISYVLKISTLKCWICNWFTLRQKCSNKEKNEVMSFA